MKQYKLKELYAQLGNNNLLFDSYLTAFYPDIEGNESNFLTDYNTGHVYLDKAFVHKFGERVIDLEAETIANAITEFRGIISGVTLLNLQNWARLYYALSLDYNPLYNVDGTTTYTHGATSETYSFGKDKTTIVNGATQDTMHYGATQDTIQYGATEDTVQYGATRDTMQYGATQTTKEYGATSDTVGEHTDTDTSYSVSFDGSTEKETGKVSHSIGSQTNTSLLHTDTESELIHTDTSSSIIHSDVTSSIIHSDVTSAIQHTDTASSIQHTDTNERDARTDGKTTLSYTDTEVRRGNIGVTKSTDLLDSEIKLRVAMGFWDTIFKTLANEGGLYYGCNC